MERTEIYCEFFDLSRKSCQDKSPLRSSILNWEPLVGRTIAIGAWASITLLYKRIDTVKSKFKLKEREKSNYEVLNRTRPV